MVRDAAYKGMVMIAGLGRECCCLQRYGSNKDDGVRQGGDALIWGQMDLDDGETGRCTRYREDGKKTRTRMAGTSALCHALVAKHNNNLCKAVTG